MTGGNGFDPDKLMRAALEATSVAGKRQVEEALKEATKASQPVWRQQLEDTIKAGVQLSTPGARRRIDETVKLGAQLSTPEARRQLDEVVRVASEALSPHTQKLIDELSRSVSQSISPSFRQQLDELAAQAARFRTPESQIRIEQSLARCFTDADRNASVLSLFGAVRNDVADVLPILEPSTEVGAEAEPLSNALTARFGVGLPEIDDHLIEAIEEIYRDENPEETGLSVEVSFLESDSRTSAAFKRTTEAFARARGWTQERAADAVAAGYMVFICYEWGQWVDSYAWATQINNSAGALVLWSGLRLISRLVVNGPDRNSPDSDSDDTN